MSEIPRLIPRVDDQPHRSTYRSIMQPDDQALIMWQWTENVHV